MPGTPKIEHLRCSLLVFDLVEPACGRQGQIIVKQEIKNRINPRRGFINFNFRVVQQTLNPIDLNNHGNENRFSIGALCTKVYTKVNPVQIYFLIFVLV